MPIAVLALQGGFAAHARRLRELGHEAVEVRAAADLEAAHGGLVLPGGESGVQLDLLDRDRDLRDGLAALVQRGVPVLGTCAGLILLSRLGWLDVAVRRNAYGRQRHSAQLRADDGTPMVLIRAPRIERVGPRVEILGTLVGEPVWVREGRVFGASFHPELTEDTRVHRRVFGAA